MEMKVSLYGYAILAAFVLGFWFVGRGLKKRGVPVRIIFYSFFLELAVTLYGAKQYTVIQSGFRTDWFRAGLSSLGGAVGLLAGVVLFGLIYGRERKLFFHMYALAVPLMYGVAKIGCYTAGCCHGIAYDGPFYVVYQNRVAQAGPYFPVQLVESIVFIGIFLTGCRLYGKIYPDRAVGIVILLCATGKFALEYLREEHIGVIFSMNQIVCAGFVLWAVSELFMAGNRTQKRRVSRKEEEDTKR